MQFRRRQPIERKSPVRVHPRLRDRRGYRVAAGAILVLNTAKLDQDGAEPAQIDALSQADLWVRFVQARNIYKLACGAKTPAAQQALETMKESYRKWSLTSPRPRTEACD